jgi:hypothetical protein
VLGAGSSLQLRGAIGSRTGKGVRRQLRGNAVLSLCYQHERRKTAVGERAREACSTHGVTRSPAQRTNEEAWLQLAARSLVGSTEVGLTDLVEQGIVLGIGARFAQHESRRDRAPEPGVLERLMRSLSVRGVLWVCDRKALEASVCKLAERCG